MKKTAKLDFEECIGTYFTDKAEITSKTKPKILFSFFYSHLDSNHQIDYNMESSCNIPTNLNLVGASKVELDFDLMKTALWIWGKSVDISGSCH